QRGFLHWMRRNGFRVVQKPVKLERDGSRRAHLEVEITTDMLSYADKIDLIILVSGDEDFAYPLNALAQKGVRVEVAGFRSAMANKVMDAADRYIELDAMIDRFRKEGAGDDEDEFRQRL
ncbi:MAG TPA: NYN domain-containing protein, partial [Holophaga sp.]|nr:NYN domain-containing protein [Holophaga sp.]